MRLLIVGTLKGQLTTATKIAMDNGASVTHAESIDQALNVLRSGRGADLLMSISERRDLCRCGQQQWLPTGIRVREQRLVLSGRFVDRSWALSVTRAVRVAVVTSVCRARSRSR